MRVEVRKYPDILGVFKGKCIEIKFNYRKMIH